MHDPLPYRIVRRRFKQKNRKKYLYYDNQVPEGSITMEVVNKSFMDPIPVTHMEGWSRCLNEIHKTKAHISVNVAVFSHLHIVELTMQTEANWKPEILQYFISFNSTLFVHVEEAAYSLCL